MNKGIALASGDYLCFLNAGDCFHEDDTLQQMVHTINGSELPDVLYGETAIVDQDRHFLRMRRLSAPETLTWKSFKQGMLAVSYTHLANYKANPIRPNIEFDDFTKLDIRVGTILECQKVPKADKLLQFKINDGLETRTIVSGIAKHYQPEELVGKQVCFIANLAPRKLKGIVSEGMILSAENNDGSLAVIMPGREVKPGSEVK